MYPHKPAKTSDDHGFNSHRNTNNKNKKYDNCSVLFIHVYHVTIGTTVTRVIYQYNFVIYMYLFDFHADQIFIG